MKTKKTKYKTKEIEECLGCTFIRINSDEKDFSAYDGLGIIQTFNDKLKDEELKKLKGKIKKLKKDKKKKKKKKKTKKTKKKKKKKLK